MSRVLLIVNPAAGGGRCLTAVGPWFDRLRAEDQQVEMALTEGPGHATHLAEQADADLVVAVGGDGTLHEVANGLVARDDPPALGILPLGTGNSFGRDFGVHDLETAFRALVGGQRRSIDVLEIAHTGGRLFSINLVSIGFVAEVGSLTNRRFKALGPLGYVAATVVQVARLTLPIFPLSVDEAPEDTTPCAFLSLSNSQYTGGSMQMAPHADPSDGLLDLVRVGAMGRRRLLALFPRIFQGTHVEAPEISETRARQVRFRLEGPIDVLVDGEVLPMDLESVTVVPGALQLAVP